MERNNRKLIWPVARGDVCKFVMEDRPMEKKDGLMKNRAEYMNLPVPSVSSSPPRYYRRQLHIDHGNL